MKTIFTAHSEPVKVLKRLQKFGYKSAIIAGGAIRDDYTGKPISDIDIFLWDPRKSSEFTSIYDTSVTRPRLDFDKASFEAEQGSWFATILQADSIEQVYWGYGQPGETRPGIGKHISGVWEAEKDYQKYQFIYTTIDPTQHVEEFFDIGLCKAYCDGEKLRYTPDFLKDLQNRTFTLVGDLTIEELQYSIEHHVEKLKHKYPGFQLEVAPHNQPLYNEYNNPTGQLFP